MDEANVESLESALGEAFSPTPAKPAPKAEAAAKVVAEPAAEVDEEAPLLLEEDPADLLQGEPEPEKAAVEEPSFEIEIDGKPEKITGAERVKELLGRGLKAGRGFEENARIREALAAQMQHAQMAQQFNQVLATDIAGIQALDQQLQQYDKIDWSSAYDTNYLEALKLKEQRDQLRERRAASLQNLNAKQQQIQAQFQQNSQRVLAAETEALLAKVPTWRNPEKAAQERGEIASVAKHYGFTPQEVESLMDHRVVLMARDAAAYRKLLANKEARVKQARAAPATAKPGAASTPQNGRIEFNKVRGKLRELGAKGNHGAQEKLATQLFERAFK